MVANNGFELDLDAGFKHTNTVEEIVADMKRTLQVISQEVDTAQASWKGTAFTSFQNVSVEWDGEAQRLNLALDTLRETLRESAFKGASTEDDEIAAVFNTMQVGGLNL